jgi:hypothetical protein
VYGTNGDVVTNLYLEPDGYVDIVTNLSVYSEEASEYNGIELFNTTTIKVNTSQRYVVCGYDSYIASDFEYAAYNGVYYQSAINNRLYTNGASHLTFSSSGFGLVNTNFAFFSPWYWIDGDNTNNWIGKYKKDFFYDIKGP